MISVRRFVVSLPLFATGATCLAKDEISQPFLGVTLYQITQTTPRPNNIRVLVIDLTNPSISFRISPRDPGLANGDETITQTTRDYVNEMSAQVGVNTSFFRLENGLEARPTNNNGISVSNGDKYSPWDATNQVGLNISSTRTATIITAPSSRPTGYETSPTVSLWNATRGSDRILTNSVNVAPADSNVSGAFLNLNPRTAAGVGTNKLILATIDGRQTGFSEGMYLREVADVMKTYGATDAINLDGGGSTTMAMDFYGDGATRSQLINHTPNNAERYVGQSLAIFAAKNPSYLPPGGVVPITPRTGAVVMDSFEESNGRFTAAESEGVFKTEFARDANQSSDGFASQHITLKDDPTTSGFELRHLSGNGKPSNNEQMGTSGYVGFLMKTTTPNLQTSLAIDEDLSAETESSTPLDIIADGQWHLYQWNLADAAQWENPIDGPTTTIDSVLISSLLDEDVSVWLDAVSYNPEGSLSALVPEPCSFLVMAGAAMLGFKRRRR